MTPQDIAIYTSSVIGLGSTGYLFKRWIDRVDNTLIEVTKGLHEHLISEESFRGDFKLVEEHIKISNGINKRILEELLVVKEEQARVKFELARKS